MPLITATNLGKSFDPQDIFSDISLSIPHRARIALVGPNGVGKTTLIRILVGLEEPSTGVVQRARGLRLGYLPQEAQFDSSRTLWEECQAVFSELNALQEEMNRLEGLMGKPGQSEAELEGTLQTYSSVQQQFEQKGGYTYETRIRQTLSGLGFTPGDTHRPVSQLSGGQRTRAYLARLLFTDPDLLLLDEPTNHLDIAAVEWLETYLRDWEGAVLIVSHDRYFLDQVAQVIWEMTPAFEVYHGNYSAYLAQRAERYSRRLDEYQAQTAFIEKEQDYIRRNMAGQNTRQAQGRRKRLERLLEESRLAPPLQTRKLSLSLRPTLRSGDLVIRTGKLSVGYADEGRPLFHVPDLTLQRGECAAIIGPNGAGKTTFLKTLLGQVPPFSGEVILGASLQIGYFAQAHEGLHPEMDLMQEIATVAPEMRPAEVRDYLARFLFTGDDVYKTVDLLSGGEGSRLALAKLALGGANLLLLDEPTNHLDLPSQEVLQGILAHFNGTTLLVSHDRYLIDALATQIWEVQPQETVLRVFEGTYSEYKAAREAEAAPLEAAAVDGPSKRSKRVKSQLGQGASPSEPKPRSPSSSALRKRREQIRGLETQIAGLEEQLASLTRQLENPSGDASRIQKIGSDYVRLQADLDHLVNEWEALHQDMGD